MDDFLEEFCQKTYRRKHAPLIETDNCKYDNHILTLFISYLYFAGMISRFVAPYVTRGKGRIINILCGSLGLFIGAIVSAFAKNIAMVQASLESFSTLALSLAIRNSNSV